MRSDSRNECPEWNQGHHVCTPHFFTLHCTTVLVLVGWILLLLLVGVLYNDCMLNVRTSRSRWGRHNPNHHMIYCTVSSPVFSASLEAFSKVECWCSPVLEFTYRKLPNSDPFGRDNRSIYPDPNPLPPLKLRIDYHLFALI